MLKYNDYVAGWLDSSIRDFLEGFPPMSAGMKFALVTCIDSNPAPASLLGRSPELQSLLAAATPFGDGLLLPTRSLLEVEAADRLFFGFDEVAFFPAEPGEPKPDAASLVGPARVDQGKLDRLGTWMERTACSLALGDGEGLNYIVKARGVVKHLLGRSIAQPGRGAAFVTTPTADLAGSPSRP